MPLKTPKLQSKLNNQSFLIGLGALVLTFLCVYMRSLVLGHSPEQLHIPWDFNENYHRFSIYISRCLRAGILPLWDPYTACGNPFHLNPQTSLWWPVTWLMALAVGYDHDVAQRQLLLTILAGGVGVYWLSYRLFAEPRSAYLSATCFMLSAGVYGNTEHWDIINGVAHAPFMALAGWSTQKNPLRGHLCVMLIVASLVVSSYPGLVIVQILWLTGFACYSIWNAPGGAGGKIHRALHWSLSAVGAGGLSAVHWLPIVSQTKYLTRGHTLNLAQSLDQSLSPSHLWGLLSYDILRMPLAAEATDVSMRGLYFSVVALPFVCLGLFYTRSANLKFFKILLVGSLCMMMGKFSFVASNLHYLFPFLSFSHFPAGDNRGLFVLAAVLLAGAGFRVFMRRPVWSKLILMPIFKWVACLVVLPAISLAAIGCPDTDVRLFYSTLIAGTSLELGFVGCAAWAVSRSRKSTSLSYASLLVGLIAADAGTGVFRNYFLVGQIPQVAPQDHPLDVNLMSPDDAILRRYAQPGALENARAYEGYTDSHFYINHGSSFVLGNYKSLASKPNLREWFLTGERLALWAEPGAPQSIDEFLMFKKPLVYRVARLSPNEVEYDIETSDDTLVVQNETSFPGWRTFVNGREVATKDFMQGLRAFSAPAGHSHVRQVFRPRLFLIGLTLSLGTALCLAISLLFIRFWRNI